VNVPPVVAGLASGGVLPPSPVLPPLALTPPVAVAPLVATIPPLEVVPPIPEVVPVAPAPPVADAASEPAVLESSWPAGAAELEQLPMVAATSRKPATCRT